MSTAPRLRADLNIVEQVYRNETSFVVKDPTTRAYFRFRPVEVQVMRLFDGARSVAQVAEHMVAAGVRVSVGTVEGFARKLSTLGLLERTLMERTTQQLERLRAERSRQRSLVRGELFRIRFPLGDPNDRLTAAYPRVRWCFTRGFVWLSLALFAAYFAIIISQRAVLARETAALFSAPWPWVLLVLFVSFTALTAVHEFGHAFACKHFGGEVHEMGAMLIFFVPAFYANVNDAWSFPDRRARLWVTFAGPWIEFAVTAVCALLWLVLAPGSWIGDFAIAAIFIGGVVNLLTNFNPLMPLDGYFALGDWLEISNLRHRAKAYASAWARHHLLREDVPLPATDPREGRTLLAYGVLAFAYTTTFLLILAARAVGVVDRLLGALAATIVAMGVLFAMRTLLLATATSARHAWRSRVGALLRRGRWQRFTVGAAAVLVAAAFIPCHLVASGEYQLLPVTSMVITAPVSGVISQVFVRERDELDAGSPVVQLFDPALTRSRLSRARLADSLSATARVQNARAQNGLSASVQAQASAAEAAVGAIAIREGALRVVSRIGGTVVTHHPEQLTGRRVVAGDTLVAISDTSRVEAVIRLRGAGATMVHVGDTVRMMSYASASSMANGVVSSIAPVAGEIGSLNVRVDVPSAPLRHVGTTGAARVLWQRASLLSAVWWLLRSLLRIDLFM